MKDVHFVDFLKHFVDTNLAGPSAIPALPGPSTNLPGPSTIPALPSTSSDTDLPSSYGSTSSPLPNNAIADSGLLTPEDIRPYPKAGPRKPAYKGRKRRKTAILTDTPVKQAREMEKNKAKSSKRLFPKKGKQGGESKSGSAKNKKNRRRVIR
uniref:Uncharacterized protein n=1 Tax=Salmo trutta TaxID=8032 RepID=A0A674APC7_SALTR